MGDRASELRRGVGAEKDVLGPGYANEFDIHACVLQRLGKLLALTDRYRSVGFAVDEQERRGGSRHVADR
jgi:hypothetical protein